MLSDEILHSEILLDVDWDEEFLNNPSKEFDKTTDDATKTEYTEDQNIPFQELDRDRVDMEIQDELEDDDYQ